MWRCPLVVFYEVFQFLHLWPPVCVCAILSPLLKSHLFSAQLLKFFVKLMLRRKGMLWFVRHFRATKCLCKIFLRLRRHSYAVSTLQNKQPSQRSSSSPTQIKRAIWIKPGPRFSTGQHARAGSSVKHWILQTSDMVCSSFPLTGALPSMKFHTPVNLYLQFWPFKGYPVCFLCQTLLVPFFLPMDGALSFSTASDEFWVFDRLNMSVTLFKLASCFLWGENLDSHSRS